MTEVINFNDSRIARGLPPIESDVRVQFAREVERINQEKKHDK